MDLRGAFLSENEENALQILKLTAPEACHRLAPSEGQKENRIRKIRKN